MSGAYKKYRDFCSPECHREIVIKDGSVIRGNCANCGKICQRVLSQAKKSKRGHIFCSQHCSGTYNNSHRTHGTRISKLEIWLAENLTKLYPDLEFHFNRKDAIESELDIYVPSLKLAFELNGIFHYEPIYGEEKLEGIKNNDKRKFAACAERGIGLCIIDTSKQKYVKESTSRPFLDIIVKIIDGAIAAIPTKSIEKLESAGLEPASEKLIP